jgi:hypothetical protein
MHEEEAFFLYRNLYRRHIRERRQQVCIHEECLLYKFLYIIVCLWGIHMKSISCTGSP